MEGNLIEAYGERKRLVQWLSDPRCIVGKSCLIARLKSGVDAETAMSSPSQRGTVLKPVAVEAVKAEKTAVDPLDSILDTLDTETLKKLLAMKLARDG